MKRNHIKVPNRLITDDSLSYSARKLGAVLYSHRNHLGTVSMNLKDMARLSGLSIATVRRALDELEQSKHLTRCKQYKYDTQRERYVYATSLYSLDLSFEGGFTFVPRAQLRKAATMGGSQFTVCLYLCFQTGNNYRAFPSLKKISTDLNMAKSTVCRVIKKLGAIGILLIQKCLKVNKAFSQNSYFFIRNSESKKLTTVVLDAIHSERSNVCRPARHKKMKHKLVSRRLFSLLPVNIIRRISREIKTFLCGRVVRKLANLSLDLDNVGVYVRKRKIYRPKIKDSFYAFTNMHNNPIRQEKYQKHPPNRQGFFKLGKRL